MAAQARRYRFSPRRTSAARARLGSSYARMNAMTHRHLSTVWPAPQSLRAQGFTLIELMITVVVAAILMSVAFPLYQHQMRESRRTDARSALSDLAGREERYYAINNVYTNSATNLGYTAWPQTVGSGYYQIAQPNVTAATA